MVTAQPARAGVVALLLGSAALLGIGLSGDLPARVLTVPAALVLAAVALRELLLRPALQADERGILVVTGLRRLALDWDEVEDLSVVRDRRAPLLQIDLGDTVVVLGRLRLGRPPRDMLEELSALQR